MGADARQGLARAERGVIGRGVTDFLASDGVLLVVERQGGPRNAADVQVIQRRVGGDVGGGRIHREVDVGQAEGL
jgi:hypothetical protein